MGERIGLSTCHVVCRVCTGWPRCVAVRRTGVERAMAWGRTDRAGGCPLGLDFGLDFGLDPASLIRPEGRVGSVGLSHLFSRTVDSTVVLRIPRGWAAASLSLQLVQPCTLPSSDVIRGCRLEGQGIGSRPHDSDSPRTTPATDDSTCRRRRTTPRSMVSGESGARGRHQGPVRSRGIETSTPESREWSRSVDRSRRLEVRLGAPMKTSWERRGRRTHSHAAPDEPGYRTCSTPALTDAFGRRTPTARITGSGAPAFVASKEAGACR